MSTARSLPRSRAWLRALVLLLALLVPGTHAETRATPVASSVETTIEYDTLDTAAALRPSSPAVHRPTAPLRPAPAPESHHPEGRSRPAPHGPSYSLRAQRTVVLRC
ncbi:hypothetical protein OH768_25710 [Streptomyces sp. NBC_01622]|uniref:hypothetical protein n=1 Tax=Streptomyces sp. NBC_01622 TaxID=2975903 RepID=UPI003869E3BD|nr:hypothetical protein OH768_25710 [Streptomyces sp. NBC_01622]